MVAPFLAAHPKIDFNRRLKFVCRIPSATGFDAGVRYGEHLAQDMIAVSLGSPQRYAVGGFRYVARHGRPEQPSDRHYACIRTRFGSGAMLDWNLIKAGAR